MCFNIARVETKFRVVDIASDEDAEENKHVVHLRGRVNRTRSDSMEDITS